MKLNMNPLVATSTFLLVVISQTLACSPRVMQYPPRLDQGVYYAEHVVYGKVLSKKPSRRYEGNLPTIKRVQFLSYCSYKGAPLPQTFEIEEVGHQPGMCYSTQLNVNQSYIVLLRNQSGELVPNAAEFEVTNATVLSELTRMCDLSLNYPSDTQSSTREVECIAPMTPPQCVTYDPNAKATTPLPPAPPLPNDPIAGESKLESTTPTSAAPQLVMCQLINFLWLPIMHCFIFIMTGRAKLI